MKRTILLFLCCLYFLKAEAGLIVDVWNKDTYKSDGPAKFRSNDLSWLFVSSRAGAYGSPTFNLLKTDVENSNDLKAQMNDKFDLEDADWPLEFHIHLASGQKTFKAASFKETKEIAKVLPF